MYLCVYFKTATALELLASNFCFSVKLFIGVAACDTSYILGKKMILALAALGIEACFAESCIKTRCWSAVLQMYRKKDWAKSEEGGRWGKGEKAILHHLDRKVTFG